MLVVIVIVAVGAFHAHSDAQFSRWVGWATVAALPVAAIASLPYLGDKISGSRTVSGTVLAEMQDQLAAQVRKEAQWAWPRLIGAGGPGDHPANVRFMKSPDRQMTAGGATVGDLNSVVEYFGSLSPGRLVILGEPGSGKTVLVTQLLISLLKVRVPGSRAPVPVLVSAAAFDSGLSWDDWLARHLSSRFGISAGAAATLVSEGGILAVVDGLDEMDAAGARERAAALIAAVNSSMLDNEHRPFVVTCRPAEYRALGRQVDRATHVEMARLTGAEAADYLQDQFRDNSGERERWAPVLGALRASPDRPAGGRLDTPWQLTLALAAFRSAGEPARLLGSSSLAGGSPEAEGPMIGHFLPAALDLHGSFGRRTGWQVQRWLAVLARGLSSRANGDGPATDIQLDTWWHAGGKRAARVVEAACLAIGVLPGAVFLLMFAGSGYRHVPLAAGFIALVGLTAAGPVKPRPHRLTAGRFKQDTATAVASSALILAGALAWGLTVGLLANARAGFFAGSQALLIFCCGALVNGGLEDRSPQYVRPGDVIRSDGRYGLAVGVIAGLEAYFYAEMSHVLATGFTSGLTVNASFAVTFGIAFGIANASAWLRYRVGAAIVAVKGQGPLRPAAFLDWACEAGLMRVSGVAYQFRHRQFQDWLADPR